MRALLFDGASLSMVDRPDPHPGPGQAVVAVLGAGLCHSDLTVMRRPGDAHPFALPIVLGHELAGTVVEIAHDVSSVRVGDVVAGYGPRGCRICRRCVSGAMNYCRQRPPGLFPPGLGSDGALAEYVVVDADSLADTGGIDPLQAAALTDAGLTAQHAIGRALAGRAVPNVLTVVVIGIGGLGHVAVQLLVRLGIGQVLAVDVSAEKLTLAADLGATHVLLAGQAVEAVRELTSGLGADAVLDFVASETTLVQAARMVAIDGVISVVGVGSGRLPVAMHSVPLGTRVDVPFWGSRPELDQVLAIARTGGLRVDVTAFALDQASAAYELLDRGAVRGRAVVRPDRSTIDGPPA
ncbi:MAG: oxidoreductase [Marmoricola sp.]|nr:oxidoreductase [Marmoricola sp.]